MLSSSWRTGQGSLPSDCEVCGFITVVFKSQRVGGSCHVQMTVRTEGSTFCCSRMTHRRANSRTYSVLRVLCAWAESKCSMTHPFQRIWPSASWVTCSMFWNQGLHSWLAPGIALVSRSCRLVHRARALRLLPTRFIGERTHRKRRTRLAKARRNRTCTQCASAPLLRSVLSLKRFLLLSQIKAVEAGTLARRGTATEGFRNLAICSP
jgi:hypothetical protein